MRAAIVAMAVASLAAAASVSVACLGEAQPPRNKKGYCRLEDLAGVNPTTQHTCEACLTQNTQCCDLYGDCEATGDCAKTLASGYRCVAGAGTLGRYDEESCLEAGTTQSNLAYGCMKDNCASECGIAAAACTPNPAVPFIAKATCDTCTTQKCCTTINSCYESRQCKLAFDCIVGCKNEFGTLYEDSRVANAILASIPFVCDGAPGSDDGGGVPSQLPCVRSCLHDFINPQTIEGRTSGCASLQLFACSYTQCQDDCSPSDGGKGD